MRDSYIPGKSLDDESTHNVHVRRADWRFLLPDPYPRRSVSYAGKSLTRALGLISEKVLCPQEAQPESCELAIVSNPDLNTLRSAWKSLSKGGILYGEWHWPLVGGPSQINRLLSRSGFEKMAFYWPWPNPERGTTLFWLPLDAPAALDYFQRTRPPSRELFQEVVRRFLWNAWKAARLAQLLVPVCITARKPSHARLRLDGWRSDSNDEAGVPSGEWDVECQAGSLHWLMLTGGLTILNKAVKIGFRRNEPDPCLVVKYARVPQSNPGLVREAENLDQLSRLPGGRPANVPRLLFLDRSREAAVVGESVVNGTPLYIHLKHDNFHSWGIKVTEWLERLVKPGEIVPRSDWWPRIAEPALAAFDRRYRREIGAGWIDPIKERLLPLQALPATFEHRDFSPWNVLVTDEDQLAVLDWEGGESNGLPGLDLIYFITFLTFFHEGAMESGDFRKAYRTAQDPDSFTGSVQAECVRIYFERLGLDPGIAKPLHILAWMIHSLSVFPRLGRQGRREGAEDPGLFIQLLAEDLEMC